MGERSTIPEFPPVASGHPRVRAVLRALRVQQAWARGDRTRAEAELVEAIEITRAAGQRVDEVDLLIGLASSGLLFDRASLVEQAIDRLEYLSAELPSPRAQMLARAYRAFASRHPLASELEAVSCAMDLAPQVARVARALLGEPASLLPVEERMTQKIRASWGGVVITTVVGAPAGPLSCGWGIDFVRRSVWLPDGRVEDLTRKDTFLRVLRSIVDAGGTVTKEHLVTSAWGEPYHPLRHNNRMQVTIRKLRLLLEEDASAPRLCVTTQDGYGLGRETTFRLVQYQPAAEGSR